MLPSRKNPEAEQYPGEAQDSDGLQERFEIEARAAAEIVHVIFQKRFGATSAFVAQNAEKLLFGIELGGVAQLGHHGAGDTVDAHAGPSRPLAVTGVRDLPQERDHAQLLHQGGVEEDLPPYVWTDCETGL
jgi:hypothetical protein